MLAAQNVPCRITITALAIGLETLLTAPANWPFPLTVRLLTRVSLQDVGMR
jgi:hypothetical protein